MKKFFQRIKLRIQIWQAERRFASQCKSWEKTLKNLQECAVYYNRLAEKRVRVGLPNEGTNEALRLCIKEYETAKKEYDLFVLVQTHLLKLAKLANKEPESIYFY